MSNHLIRYLIPLILLIIIVPLISESAAQTNPTIKEFTIVARQWGYEPSVIEVNRGDEVIIKLKSADVSHGIFIEGYDVGTKLILKEGWPPEKTIRFVADKPGAFTFRCNVNCGQFHPFMTGKLIVKPNYPYIFSSTLAVLIAAVYVVFLHQRRREMSSETGEEQNEEKNTYWKFDLLQIPPIKKLLKLRSFQFIVIFPNILLFFLLISAAFFGTPVGSKNISSLVVFLWLALLMLLLVPLGGRVWCMSCPMPAIGEWIQRGTLTGKSKKTLGMGRMWPEKLDNIWLQNFTFLLLSTFIGVFATRTYATGWLLVILLILPVIFFLIYRGRVWCRYICPVSGFVGLYSMIAPLELRVKDRNLCVKHVGKDCIRGNEKGYACPWHESPPNLNRNAYCGLCMECIKTCPLDNISLNLRLGGEDLYVEPSYGARKRGLDEAYKTFIMTTLAVVYALIFVGPYDSLKSIANFMGGSAYASCCSSISTLSNGVEANVESFFPENFAIFFGLIWGSTLIVTPGLYSIFIALSRAASGARISFRKLFINYSYTLIPESLVAWMAFSVYIILINGSYLIAAVSDPFGWGWDLFGTAHYQWTPYLTWLLSYIQIALIILGFIFSIKVTHEISNRTFNDESQAFKASIPLIAMHLGFTLLVLRVWIGGII
jgi:plastocyanin